MTDANVEELSTEELYDLFSFADSLASELKERGLNCF